ncbi:hypothetical protein OROGR_027980 [Orobanche gracilis]
MGMGVYKLPTEQIYATYFGGDEKLGLDPDFEAKEKWLELLPKERVLPFGCKDNFWEMGDTGPCGPCTEIDFDRIGGGRDAASMVNNDDPTVIEIWNLVFIQFNREADGVLKSLPAKHVDTGMGFERLTSILQNKMSNYDTDIFVPIFDAIQKATEARPYSGKVGRDDRDSVDMAYRVVADHIRTISFAIADGSRPDVLVQVVVAVMGEAFPELALHAANIKRIIEAEEASFGRTLTKGIEKFKKAAQEVEGKALSGQDAFDLWDTYGFPLDLTQLMAEERGLTVDVEGFNAALNKARERSRNAQNKQAGAVIVMDADATASLHKKGVAATDDSFKFTWFKEHTSEIKAIYTGKVFLESVVPGEEVGLILETTSFYAEQGGQIYDTGKIEGLDGDFEVSNVHIYGGFVIHIGSFRGKTGRLYIGEEVVCKVDYDRRTLIAPNHTCTHMLNFALREVLGTHVDQKGSIVLPEKLRYDFSHAVEPENLRKIESIVNEQIKAELDVFAKETKFADAKRINGLRAVFGEVYPDPVRVVSVGRKVEDLLANPENEEWKSISAELCGGTHISNTREAKAFAILSEEGIAKGIRRVTAVTSDYAFKALELASSLEQEINEASKTEGHILEQKVTSLNSRLEGASIPSVRKADLKEKISALQVQVIKAKKEIAETHTWKAIKAAIHTAEEALSKGKTFCISRVDVGSDTTVIRKAVVEVMKGKGVAVMLFSRDEALKKTFVCAGVPEKDDKYKQLNVAEWLRKVLELINGRGGGGKGGIAYGQGSDDELRIETAINVAESFASMKLT